MSNVNKNMDANYKRHGRKSSKETQSPVLKVFRDMMQQENNDPEKANLLKKKEDKKKPTNSASRIRDSRPKPFHGATKDTWGYLAQDSKVNKKQSEDTCSCVSCALKKVIGSEYTCMACLGVLFLISVLVAFLVIFKTVPICGNAEPQKSSKTDRNTFKNKFDIDILKDVRRFGADNGVDDRRTWDDTVSRHSNGMTGLTANDYSDPGYRDWSTLDDSALKADRELNSILDTEKLNEGLSSDRLRNFYKKLIQTDTQIRNLKKSANDLSEAPMHNGKFSFMSDRRKRSLRLANQKGVKRSIHKLTNSAEEVGQPDISKFNLYFPPYIAVNFSTPSRKIKRLANATEEPTGYLLEKKQILVQYKPHGRLKVPKCSHAPKDSSSHEKQLKHPFYKNSQRIDEMLDQLLDRKLPDMMADPFGVEGLFKSERKELHEKPNTNVKGKAAFTTPFAIKSSFVRDDQYISTLRPFKPSGPHALFEFLQQKREKISTSTLSSINVLLSVSTILNGVDRKSPLKKAEKLLMSNSGQKSPYLRKLMQANEEDEEALGYEDLNEVLSDDTEEHDDTDKGQDRRKRMNEYPGSVRTDDEVKVPNSPYHTKPALNNRDWKGPMPLYPDELISMIKQAAMENINNVDKIKVPLGKDASEMDNLESQLNDMDYIENYSDKKNNKLAKMAQAYSDYGLLASKKESTSVDKNLPLDSKPGDHRVKLSIDKGKKRVHSFFDRFKKGSEGIRFELRPTTATKPKASPAIDVVKVINQHVRFGKMEKSDTSNLKATEAAKSFKASPELKVARTKNSRTNEFGEPAKLLTNNKRNARSLLSIVEADVNNTDFNTTDKTEDFEEINSPERDIVRTVLDVHSANMKNKNETSKMDLSDFFLMISSWFGALAGSATNTTKSLGNNSSMTSFQTEIPKPGVFLLSNKSKDLMYPNYDSDMIENIGHRSRVLMSIEDLKESSAPITITLRSDNDKYHTVAVEEPFEVTTATKNTFTNLMSTEETTFGKSKAIPITDNPIIGDGNKTIVKRNIAGGNLIFWNDMYDDEYGVKLDPLDNPLENIRDKQYGKSIDFVKKSGSWIHDKVRSFANNMRGKDKADDAIDNASKRSLRGARYLGTETYPKYNIGRRFQKRSVRHKAEESDGQINSFEDLTAKMKDVCKEAAMSVKQTRNKEVRQDDKEESMTSSLMQQLVRLMTDLIDFQVQQKTCVKLPQDLQDFLEWITSAKSDNLEAKQIKMGLKDNGIDQSLEPETMKLNVMEEERPDLKMECLTTVHSIQDLIQEFDEMSDENKSKMTGVKEYLDSQLLFLNKQLSNFDEDKQYPAYQDIVTPLRFRRHASYNKCLLDKYRRPRQNEWKRRYRRKFLKNFGKKHTRSTASIYDGLEKTETYQSSSKRNVDKISNADKLESNEVVKAIQEKRNLKDVYYKAVEDAKKFTTLTVRNMLKKEEIEGFDNAHVVRIDK